MLAGDMVSGVGLPYEMVGQKVWIELVQETNVGIGQASFDPLKIPLKRKKARLPATVQEEPVIVDWTHKTGVN